MVDVSERIDSIHGGIDLLIDHYGPDAFISHIGPALVVIGTCVVDHYLTDAARATIDCIRDGVKHG